MMTCTIDPGAAVPESVGEALLVMPSSTNVPVSLSASCVKPPVISAASGGVVSIVKVLPSMVSLILPAASVKKICGVHSPSGRSTVSDHWPSSPTGSSSVNTLSLSKNTVTMEPGSAVPVSVGVAFLVMPSSILKPVSLSSSCTRSPLKPSTEATVLMTKGVPSTTTFAPESSFTAVISGT